MEESKFVLCVEGMVYPEIVIYSDGGADFRVQNVPLLAVRC